MPSKSEKFKTFPTLVNTKTFMLYNLQAICEYRGMWNTQIFKSAQPITLELGCGRGEYTIGLAAANPFQNYIGIDLKSNRMWTGAQQAINLNLNNVQFLRTRVEYIERVFSESEINEIWIMFPDPQPQKPRARKRLTHPRFLQLYKKVLKPGGIIHLKTDSRLLYDYTLEVVKSEGHTVCCHTPDLYAQPIYQQPELTTIQTYYETLFKTKGAAITYIQFKLA